MTGATPDSDHPVTRSSPQEHPVFNRVTLDEVTGNDSLIADAFIRKVISLLPEYTEEVVSGLAKEDLAGAQAQAHRLKGVAASVGGERLRALMAETEKNCKDRVVASPGELIRRVRAQTAELEHALKRELSGD